MSNFIDKVSCNFTIEEIKNIIQEIYNNPECFDVNYSCYSCYNYFKQQVNDHKKITHFDELVTSVFKNYVQKLNSINMEATNDEALLSDYKLILSDETLQNAVSANSLFTNPNFCKLNYKLVHPQKGDAKSCFTHFNTLTGDEPIECRLYLSPEMDKVTVIAEEIIAKHTAASLPCYFKICTDEKRIDRIVLYSSLENAQKHVDILNEIKNEHKDWFLNCNKNMLWGKIENVEDIYFGMEPFNVGKNSYGSIRGAVFDESLWILRNKYGDDISEVTDEMAADFMKILKIESLMLNVDSENFALNKNKEFDNERYGEVSYINLKYQDKGFSVWPARYDINKDTIGFVVNNSWADFTVTYDELELLYKKQPGEKNYKESEQIRLKFAKYFYKKEKKAEKYQQRNSLDQILFSEENMEITNDGIKDKKLPLKLKELAHKIEGQLENIRNKFVDSFLTKEIISDYEEIEGYYTDEIRESMEMIKSELDSYDESKKGNLK